MSVSLAEVILAARARQASLAGESAGYLVLAVADQVASAARAVRPDAVELNEDGSIRLCAGEPTNEGEAERLLRALLGELLDAASSLTPALVRVRSKSPPASLARLVAELEAALIPVNRAAARRALARLSRETARALEEGLTPPKPRIDRPAPSAWGEPGAELVQPTAVAAEVELELEIEIEVTPEPLETRPEPIVQRASSRATQPPARTPRLGTLMAPSVRVEAQDAAEVTDPMPSIALVDLEPEEPVASAAPAELEPAPPASAPDALPRSREPRRSELDNLLKSFASSGGPSEPDVRRELKKIAGVELTPAPTPATDPAAGV